MKNLLVAIPQLEVHRPPVSTAVIAGALEGSGHTVECIDLNILMYEQLGSDKYYDFGNIWEKHRLATSEEQQIQEEFIKKNLFPILTPDTRLMISVFSINSHLFCVQLCRLIRKHYPTVQIVIGGAGVSAVTYAIALDHNGGRRNNAKMWGIISSVAIGTLKEAMDSGSGGTGFDWADIGYTVAGGIVGTYTFDILANRAKKRQLKRLEELKDQ